MRAREQEIRQRRRFREAGRRERDVIASGEEKAGAGFGDGDGGEPRGKDTGVAADGPAVVVGGGEGGGGGAEGMRGAVGRGFGFGVGEVGGREAGDGGLVDAGLVVEEDVDVIEAGSEFEGEDFEFDVGLDHGEDVLLDDD